ncbi:hypothetical protein BIU82_15010 [Arthrobacter sp. SW1]|uniref:PGAP1-like alpha/beta domain-containing protein n=1 Tax=Arthrobacter sp. SW1 TaxID=1920889 RepID=UPI000877CFCA|nr:hypothetical protein [Arthrobacter sp. SW1]OFI39176.1 hypothetical protein BIU82_15010 [Arthrobacter sp. SW1]
MGIFGMDIEQGKALGKQMEQAAERFTQLGRNLTPVITGSPWDGPDGRRFKNDWEGHRHQLLSTSEALRAAAKKVQEHVREQEKASGFKGAQGGPGLFESFGRLLSSGASRVESAVDGLVDGIKGGIDFLKDGAEDVAGGVREGAEDVADGLKDGAGKLLGGLKDGVDFLKDGAEDIAEGVQDGAEDALDWAMNSPYSPINNLLDAEGDALDAIGNIGRLGWDALRTGEPPSITELVAGGGQLLAAGANLTAVIGSGGFFHPHLLDDGSPEASEPYEVGVGDAPTVDGHKNTPVPDSLSSILGGVTAAYDDGGKDNTPDAAVRITTVDKGDGNGPAYIVSIPGTSEWNVQSGSNPLDTVGNLSAASGDSSTASQAVQLALEEAGVPSDAPVMLVGHSQGGIIAAGLAADEDFRNDYNVTNVLTYGAPIDSTHIPDNINTVAIQHPYDVVPRLDLGNAKPSPFAGIPAIPWSTSHDGTVVTLPTPDGVDAWDAAGNHDYNNYADSVAANEGSGALADYRNDPSTQRFITDDPSHVTSTTSNISRKE